MLTMYNTGDWHQEGHAYDKLACSQVFNSVFTGQFSTDLSDGWPGAKKYNLFEEIYWR